MKQVLWKVLEKTSGGFNPIAISTYCIRRWKTAGELTQAKGHYPEFK